MYIAYFNYSPASVSCTIPSGSFFPPSHACFSFFYLQTMKKKFFVLRGCSNSGPARLEYYDSEKKYRTGAGCKRSIELAGCFNINKKMDPKHKHAISLFTKDDCFSVVAENVDEQESWLGCLLDLQNDSYHFGKSYNLSSTHTCNYPTQGLLLSRV